MEDIVLGSVIDMVLLGVILGAAAGYGIAVRIWRKNW